MYFVFNTTARAVSGNGATSLSEAASKFVLSIQIHVEQYRWHLKAQVWPNLGSGSAFHCMLLRFTCSKPGGISNRLSFFWPLDVGTKYPTTQDVGMFIAKHHTHK